jgi:hypothetical protein
MTLSLHTIVHIFQTNFTHDCKNIIKVILCYTLDTIIIKPYIPHANKKCSSVQ